MAYRILYSCTNEGATWGKLVLDKTTGKIKVDGGGGHAFVTDTPGACFGYSFDWTRRMLTGEAKTSKPNVVAAVPLQQYYEMKIGKNITDATIRTAVDKTFTNSGYKMGRVTKRSYPNIASEVRKHGGSVSILKMNIHWVGAGWKGGVYYLFDSNVGLMAGETEADMKSMLSDTNKMYKAYGGYARRWDMFEVVGGTDP